MDLAFQLIILIMSVVVHEVSHGYAAMLQGDHTAEYQGRLTLNPLEHLDSVGSFLVPLMSYFLGGFIIGWAKPVPFNPYNLRNRRWGEALVAVAGPLSNICIAGMFSLIIRFGSATLPGSFIQVSALIVFINILLAVFILYPFLHWMDPEFFFPCFRQIALRVSAPSWNDTVLFLPLFSYFF